MWLNPTRRASLAYNSPWQESNETTITAARKWYVTELTVIIQVILCKSAIVSHWLGMEEDQVPVKLKIWQRLEVWHVWRLAESEWSFDIIILKRLHEEYQIRALLVRWKINITSIRENNRESDGFIFLLVSGTSSNDRVSMAEQRDLEVSLVSDSEEMNNDFNLSPECLIFPDEIPEEKASAAGISS